MKICVISSSVLPCPPKGYSGLEMLAWQQAEGLARKGHEVALVAPEGSSCPNVRMIFTGPPGQWDERKSFDTYWQQLPVFDVIIDNSWQKYTYMLKAEGVLKCPVLGVCHAPINTMYQSLPPVEKPCFVCISQDQAAHFEGLFSKRAKVVYNGVDTEYYKSTGVKRSNRFLFLARFSAIKGADLAEDVCIHCNVGLDLVGDTTITGEPDYLEKCKKKADGQLIKLVGPATRSDCVHWFSQARALLHCNKFYREPYGLAPVEAQLCGLGVLAFDYGAMRETIKHGETGFLVNSAEEMVELINVDAIGSIRSERCREWASQFSIENMINRWEQVIQDALAGGW